MQIQQVPPHQQFPSGEARPIATLRFSPSEISTRFGISFEDGFDDFDHYTLAALQDMNIGQIWLFRYFHSPESGTEILVDSSTNVAKALSVVIAMLELTTDDLIWVVEDGP